MKRLEDCHIVAHFCQIAGAGQACRTRTDHRHFMSVFVIRRLWTDAVRSRPVGCKSLQLADRHRISLISANTFSLALALLRAHTAAGRRKRGSLTDGLIRLLKLLFFYPGDKCRDINRHRTSFDALCIFTVQAARRLFHRLFLVISKTHFLKVRRTNQRLLLANRYSF